MKNLILSTLATTTLSSFAGEALSTNSCNCDLHGTRPDAHAPIGVMGDHIHKQGEWMFSYRYMNMHMEDLYRGSDTIPNTMAASGYMMTPLDMDMNMHMFGVMYAPTDKLTLMFMTNYIETKMTMANAAGVATMNMRTSGLGDSSITALYQIHQDNDSNAHLGLGLLLPTGATDKKIASAPMPPAIGRDQPFLMQLGTGSFALLPSLTYNQQINNTWSWGTQAKATIFLDENDDGYTHGNQYSATAWASRNFGSKLSVSARLEGRVWDEVDGTQTNGLHALNPVMSSPADPSNTGGQKLDALIGLNYLITTKSRFALEFGKTVHQDLDGVQLGTDWTATAGLQFAW